MSPSSFPAPLRLLRGAAAAALAVALVASVPAAAQSVRLYRDVHASSTVVDDETMTVRHVGAPRCACHRRHRLVHRYHRAPAYAGGGVPYDDPPVQDYAVVGYVDGPHLGRGGAEGAEPGYGHCRWERVSDGGGEPRWGKVCARAGYFSQTTP